MMMILQGENFCFELLLYLDIKSGTTADPNFSLFKLFQRLQNIDHNIYARFNLIVARRRQWVHSQRHEEAQCEKF